MNIKAYDIRKIKYRDFNMDDANYSNYAPEDDKFIFIQDAIIETIYRDNRTGYVTISYGILGDSTMIQVQLVTLIVSRGTRIRDQFGRHLRFQDLRVGMFVDAVISSIMTRSYPPQSNAFIITVITPEVSYDVTVDRIIDIDPENNFLYTGDPNDILTQMRFVIMDSTVILDRRGNRIQLEDLRPDQVVRIEHAIFQTASIPPQTTAFLVQVL